MAITSKRCTKCDQVKPLDQFPADKRRPNGYRANCKVCTSAVKKAWALANQDKVKAAHAEYVRLHPNYNGEMSRRRTKATLPGASRRGEPWTQADLDVVFDESLTINEICERLGRTYFAVAVIKNKYKGTRTHGNNE